MTDILPDWDDLEASGATPVQITPQKSMLVRPAPSDDDRLLSAITKAARDSSVDVDKFERLMDLYKSIKTERERRAYDAALRDLQPQLPVISKKGLNPNTQSTFAKWEDIIAAITPILPRNGFSLSFRAKQETGLITVTAILAHEDGHREETDISLAPDTGPGRNAAQAVGSALSYAKRYASTFLLNLQTTGEDNDGNGGGSGRNASAAVQAAITGINLAEGKEGLREWKRLNSAMIQSLPQAEADQVVQHFNMRWNKAPGA